MDWMLTVPRFPSLFRRGIVKRIKRCYEQIDPKDPEGSKRNNLYNPTDFVLSGRIGLNEPFCLYADSHSYWKCSHNPWLRAQIILWDRVTISHAISESTEPRTEIDVSWLVKHGRRKSWVLDVSESFVSSPSRILMLLLPPCSWQNQHATD